LIIPEDFFFIEHENDSHILYLPSIGAAFLVNGDTKELFDDIATKKAIELNEDTLATINYFILNGIIVHSSSTETAVASLDDDIEDYIREYSPTYIILCPTSACNLRCVYCYASGGEKPEMMDFELARQAIDYLVANGVKSGDGEVTLGFHGTGEPMVAFDLMRRCIDYARERTREEGLRLWLSMTTNLMVDEERLEFIIDNFDNLVVSFDGPKDIQDTQRPAADGTSSYDLVAKNLKELDGSGLDYNIRSTILNKNIDRMEEIAEFFIRNFPNARKYSLVPFGKIGRASERDLEGIDWEAFLRHFARANELAGKLGRRIEHSRWGLDTCGTRYCGALSRGFFVSMSGYVYSCDRTVDCDDPTGLAFRIGRFDASTGEFVLDAEKLRGLMKRHVDNIPNCKDCFAKYNCMGGCPVLVMGSTGDHMVTSDLEKCEHIRRTIRDDLLKLLSDNKYRIEWDNYVALAEPDKLNSSDLILE
jgi:uncharacterized protein